MDKKNRKVMWELPRRFVPEKLNDDISCVLEGENPCIVISRCNRRKICDVKRKQEFKEREEGK